MKTIVSFFLFCYFFFNNLLCYSFPPIIQEIEITKNRLLIKTNKQFFTHYLTDNFFVEYPDNVIDLTCMDFSIATIPFVTAIIPLIWATNTHFSIATMDADLFYALQKIKRTLQFFYPHISWNGQLIPEQLIKNRQQSNNAPIDIALLFSGGLDAVYSSLKYTDKTQLLITVWGSDVYVADKNMWHHVLKWCATFAHNNNHQHTWIRSNFMNFFNVHHFNSLAPTIPLWWSSVMQALTYFGVSLPLCYTYDIPYLVIGSSHTKDFAIPYGTHPLIDNSLNAAGIQMFHDGADTHRNEKIKNVAQFKSKTPLRVCWKRDQKGGNCCRCSKCLRTIIGFMMHAISYQEYGFNTNDKLVLKKLKKFANQPTIKKYYWHALQKKSKTILQSNTQTIPPTQKEIFLLLAHFPLKEKIDLYESYCSAEKLSLLSNLWQESVEINTQYFNNFYSKKKAG